MSNLPISQLPELVGLTPNFDTTVSNILDITAQFSSTNSANFIRTELLVLSRQY
jgi:hypothetical protein